MSCVYTQDARGDLKRTLNDLKRVDPAASRNESHRGPEPSTFHTSSSSAFVLAGSAGSSSGLPAPAPLAGPETLLGPLLPRQLRRTHYTAVGPDLKRGTFALAAR